MNPGGIFPDQPIYLPQTESEIILVNIVDGDRNLVISASPQWNRLNAYIE
ncbi:hypothetical protein AB9P05_07205 [Roseivirga sp. BDSF3-8]